MVLQGGTVLNERETLEFFLYLVKYTRQTHTESAEKTAAFILAEDITHRLHDDFMIRVVYKNNHVYCFDQQGLEVAAI